MISYLSFPSSFLHFQQVLNIYFVCTWQCVTQWKDTGTENRPGPGTQGGLTLSFPTLEFLCFLCAVRNHGQQGLQLSCELHIALPDLWLSAQSPISLIPNFGPLVIISAWFQFIFTFIISFFSLMSCRVLFNYNIMVQL